MRVLVHFLCAVILLVHFSLCIRLPGQNIDKNTLTTLGIKTLDWQGEEDNANSSFSQVNVHHNYSKVSVQNQGVGSFSQSQTSSSQSKSSFSDGQIQDFYQSQVSGIGQKSVGEDDYFDLTPQVQDLGGDHEANQQIQEFQTSFGGQQKDDLDLDEFSQFSENDGGGQFQVQSSFDEAQQLQSFEHQQKDDNKQIVSHSSKITNTNQASNSYSPKHNNFDQNQNSFTPQTFDGQEDNYDELSTASSHNNRQIYNAHSYGNMLQLDQVMQAENDLQNQQFEDFPDYELGQIQLVDQNSDSTNVEQEERQAKHFYPVNKPIYIHGFKYPPDPEDVYPLNKQTAEVPPEIYTKCPKMATGQFVHSASCNQFLNCWKGRGFVQNCAPGTLFNPKTLECDFASKVQCITGPRKPEQNQYKSSQKLEISCPAEFSGVVPHHTDCSKFINCANGVEHVMDCPPGTLFSLKINNCDHPYRTECASWSVQFGNIKNYYLQSGNSGKFNYGNYQGQDNINKYGQNNYYQSGNNKHDQKYASSDGFRFHRGSGTTNKLNQNQGSGLATHSSGSQQNIYGQGTSSTNKNIYGQNAFGAGQGTKGEGEYYGSQQNNQGTYQGYYGAHGNLNQHSQQSNYGQDQQSGQNLHGLSSQNVVGFGQQHESKVLSQDANSQSSSTQQSSIGQESNLLGQNQYQQNQDLFGSQSQYIHGTHNLHGQNQNSYGQNQELFEHKNVQSENQNFYGQNQETIGSQSQYHHESQNTLGQNQNNFDQNQDLGHQDQSLQENQNVLGQKQNYGQNQEFQGQYYHGSQSQNFYGQGINKNQNQNVGSSGSSKFSTGGNAKCPDGATGLLPHPSDCSKFLNCASGQTSIQDCGPGTVFNPDSKVCDFPYKVKCQQHSEDYSGLINVRTELEPKPSENQQYQQGTNTHGSYISQGSDTDGSAAANQWQSGQSADGSSSHKQKQHSGVSGNVYQETLDGSGSSFKGHDYISSSSTQKSKGFATEEVAKCPQHASGLYPHPTICSKFLNCANGQTFIQDCGPGTVFNPVHKVCDFPYNVECGGGDYGEGLIDIKKIPSTSTTENSQAQGWYDQNQNFNSNNKNQGSYGQNQNVGGTSSGKTQHEHYGQAQATNWNPQNVLEQGQNVENTQQGQTNWNTSKQQGSYGHKQNTLIGTANKNQGLYGQGSTTNTQHQGSYGQNQNTLIGTTNKNQGLYGQSATINTQQQGSYDKNIGSSSSGQAVYSQHSGNNKQQQQGFYGTASTTGQQEFHSQHQNTGSTWVNKNQQGFYGQTETTNEDQDLQESKNYNQQFYGSSSTQSQNTNKHQWQTQYGSQLKPHHSPPPFPSTDINADYEFGNEGSALEVGPLDSKPKAPKPFPKRKDFCEPLDFHCSTDDCIPQSMVCDGVKDCPTGIDEQNCEKYLHEFGLTPNTILAVREKERYLNISLIYCAKSCLESKGFQCKSFSYRKDDGACFLSDTNVGHSGALIISHPYNYYEVKAFTVNCTNLYKCPSQKCINFKQVCDGINDCGDRTDEKGCSADSFGYQIRLGGTDKKHEGRIELKAFGKWGYVCDDKFGLRDADVVCRELGFPLGSLEVKANSYYAQDLNEEDVLYLMDDVTCLGNETSLRDCDFNGWGVNNCEPQEVVGILCKTPLENCPKNNWKCDSDQECIPLSFVCDGVFDCTDQSDEGAQHCEAPIEFRLANGKSKYEGRIEIRYHGIWGTVCDDDFNDDSAKVVCKQLGYPGNAVAKKDGFFGAGKGPIWLDQVFCQGNETGIEHCVHWNWGEHNCEHAEDVGIICSNTYDNTGHERSVKLDPRHQIDDVLPGYLFPERCGLRKDDQFLEDDAVHFRVVKGSNARMGDYPWQASLRIKNTLKPVHWCGAVVISQKFVLTAAHCLSGFAKGAYFIVAGDYNTDDDEGTEQEAYIEEFYIHEDFRSGGHKMNNDIALVKLKGQGLTFTKDVQPICLPEADLEYDKELNCTISGFGSIESGKSGYSHQLRAGWVPLQSREVCQMPHVYGSTITEGMICAGSLDEGIDACDGDSGGPLACLHEGLFTLYGLTSWGHHCGHANKPGVYVKISHYRKWIDHTMKKHS